MLAGEVWHRIIFLFLLNASMPNQQSNFSVLSSLRLSSHATQILNLQRGNPAWRLFWDCWTVSWKTFLLGNQGCFGFRETSPQLRHLVWSRHWKELRTRTKYLCGWMWFFFYYDSWGSAFIYYKHKQIAHIQWFCCCLIQGGLGAFTDFFTTVWSTDWH